MRVLTRFVLGAAALVLIAFAAESRTTGILANTAVVTLLAAVMARSRRTDPVLRRTRTWMLAALMTGVVAGLAAVVDELLAPGGAYPRPGDVLELLYVPCVLTALLVVPLQGVRRGVRARAGSGGCRPVRADLRRS